MSAPRARSTGRGVEEPRGAGIGVKSMLLQVPGREPASPPCLRCQEHFPLLPGAARLAGDLGRKEAEVDDGCTTEHGSSSSGGEPPRCWADDAPSDSEARSGVQSPVSRYFDPAERVGDGQFTLPEATGRIEERVGDDQCTLPEADTVQEMYGFGDGFSEYGQWPVLVPLWSCGEEGQCVEGAFAPLCPMPLEVWESCDWDCYNWRSERRSWRSWQTEGRPRSRGHRAFPKPATPHRDVSDARLDAASPGHREPTAVLIDLSLLVKVPRNSDGTRPPRPCETRAPDRDESASPELIEDQG